MKATPYLECCQQRYHIVWAAVQEKCDRPVSLHPTPDQCMRQLVGPLVNLHQCRLLAVRTWYARGESRAYDYPWLPVVHRPAGALKGWQ